MTKSNTEDRANADHIRQSIEDLFAANSHEEVANRAKNLVGFLYNSQILDRWAGAITRRVGWAPEQRFDDVRQAITERLLHHLQHRTDRLEKILRSNKDVVAGVFHMLSSEAWTMSRSSASTGMTGMTGALRRDDRYKKFERELSQQLGRTPETQEVVAMANADAANRKNAAREGILLDGKNHDVSVITEEEPRPSSPDTSEAGLDPALFHDFIEVVRQISTTLMVLYPAEIPAVIQTLKSWFWAHKEGAIAIGPEESTELAAYAGISEDVASKHLHMIYTARDRFLAESRTRIPPG